MEESSKDVFQGTVVWFDRLGKGFIDWQKNGIKQKDMFVHYSDIDTSGFRMLYKGQEVSFQVGLNHKNQPKAVNVKIIK